MDEWVTVDVDGRKVIGRKCSFADYKKRRLERRLALGLAEVIPVEEYLE